MLSLSMYEPAGVNCVCARVMYVRGRNQRTRLGQFEIYYVVSTTVTVQHRTSALQHTKDTLHTMCTTFDQDENWTL